MNRDLLLSDLERDEGIKPILYDDHNGKPLQSGSVIVGNPTLGIGWNVATTPLTTNQYITILGWLVDAKLTEVRGAIPFFDELPDDVQRAVANMAFNMGVPTLQTFTTFLGLLKNARYELAADDLETTKWYGQVGARAVRICALIRGGAQA